MLPNRIWFCPILVYGLSLATGVQFQNLLSSLFSKPSSRQHCAKVILSISSQEKRSDQLGEVTYFSTFILNQKKIKSTTAASRISRIFSCVILVTFDLDEESLDHATSFLKTFSDREILTVVGQEASAQEVLSKIQRLSTGFRITVAEMKGNQYVVHVKCPKYPLMRSVNVWKAGFGFKMPPFECPHVLRGVHMNVSYSGMPPYIVHEMNEVHGSDVDALTSIANHFQFTFSLKEEDTWLAMAADSDHYEGVIGEVFYERSHVGIGHITMVDQYYQLVDFSTMLYMIPIHFCARKPNPLPQYWNIIRPFPTYLWNGMILTLCLGCMTDASLRTLHGKISKDRLKLSFECLISSALNLCRSHLSQAAGYAYRTVSDSTNVFIFFWVVYVFLLTSFYECNLRAYLLSVDFEDPINNEDDIYRLGRKLHMPRGSPFPALFRTSPLHIQRLLFYDVIRGNRLYNMVEGRRTAELDRQLIDTGGVFIWNKDMALAAAPEMVRIHGEQPWRLGDKTLFTLFAGLVMPKNTEWRNDFNSVAHRLIDSGLVQFYLRKYIKANYMNDDMDKVGPVAFGTQHIFGALVVLGIGLSLGLATFAFESNNLIATSINGRCVPGKSRRKQNRS